MNPQNIRVAKPYAEALLEIAKNNSIEKTTDDLIIISSIINQSEELRELFKNPLINSQTKKTIIKSIFLDKIGEKMQNFLLLLCDRERINYLELIINKSIELIDTFVQIETVKVKTAIPFNNTQQELLLSKLKKMTGAKQIKLDIKIDRNLLGGFTIQIKSTLIDTSIQNQLKQLASYVGASIIN